MDNYTAPEQVSVSPDVAARLIGIGRTKVFELIRDGDLPIAKVGRRTLIPVADLHSFIEHRVKREAA